MNETISTRPGYKTTEFWLSLLATVLGSLLACGVMDGVCEQRRGAIVFVEALPLTDCPHS